MQSVLSIDWRAIACSDRKISHSRFIELEGIAEGAAIAVIALFIIRNNYQLANFKPSYSESNRINAKKKVKGGTERGIRGESPHLRTTWLQEQCVHVLPYKTQHPMVQDGATTRPKYHSGDFRWLCSAHHSCGARAGEDEEEGGGSMEPAAEGAPLRPPRARDACAQNIKRLFLYEAS